MGFKQLFFFAACLLLLQGAHFVRAELEGFDEPESLKLNNEFEELSAKSAEKAVFKAKAIKRPVQQASLNKPRQETGFAFEAFTVIFLLSFAVAAYYGSRKNSIISEAWAQQFCGPDGLFDKNFSLIGTGGPEILKKENACQYKFYASGRRYCQGLLATIHLRGRSNLFAYLFELISPSEDVVNIEVFMNEENMPPIILAIGVPKVLSNLQNNSGDIKTYTRKVNINSSEQLYNNWSNKKLQVSAEHSSVFYDLFSDPKLVQVLTSPQYAESMRFFRSLHISDSNTSGSHKRILKFHFALPSCTNDMVLLAPLMELIPKLIDTVGTFKLSADIKRKMQEQRVKLQSNKNADEEAVKARQEALMQKRVEKMQEEKERLARMNPEARRKYEEKQAAKMAKKSMKVKMVK